jgi:carbon storage regulator
MLVLTRKLGQRIWIGETVCVTLVDIDRGKVRLGIQCPRDVPVFREELIPPGRSVVDMAFRRGGAVERAAGGGA